MIQEWVDAYREGRLRLTQWSIKRKVVSRGYWRAAIGRPWPEAICWWCLAAICVAGVTAWLVFR